MIPADRADLDYALKLSAALQQHLDDALSVALLDPRFETTVVHGKRIAVNAIGNLLVTYCAAALVGDPAQLVVFVKQIVHVLLTLCVHAPRRDPDQLAAMLRAIDEFRTQLVAIGTAGRATETLQ